MVTNTRTIPEVYDSYSQGERFHWNSKKINLEYSGGGGSFNHFIFVIDMTCVLPYIADMQTSCTEIINTAILRTQVRSYILAKMLITSRKSRIHTEMVNNLLFGLDRRIFGGGGGEGQFISERPKVETINQTYSTQRLMTRSGCSEK